MSFSATVGDIIFAKTQRTNALLLADEVTLASCSVVFGIKQQWRTQHPYSYIQNSYIQNSCHRTPMRSIAM